MVPYRPRPIKRRRRSAAEMDGIREAIYAITSALHPMSVRQVFYQLTTQGVIEKTESEYKQTVIRLLGEMRLNDELPFSWIADNSRWMRKPETYSSLKSMLDITASTYRRALWTNQEDYVEIWLEKEALSGVIYSETDQWDVPLMVTRGYPSLTFLHEAAEAIAAEERPVYIYYLGDWDPSGLDIARNVQERLEEFAPYAEIHFERIAVTPEQIEEWNLPTRPTKQTDTRSRGFSGASIELDAIPPDNLRQLVTIEIEWHVDDNALEKTRIAEASERKLLDNWKDLLGNAAPE